MKKKLLLALCGLSVLTSAAVFADGHSGPHDKSIKARQAMFQLYSYHIGVLSAMAKGDAEYNADIAMEVAKNLDAAANLGQSTFWPAGSDNSNEDNARTRALPVIWETFPAIAEKAEGLQKATANLVANAGTLDGLKGSVGDVGAACKACHDDYRAKRK